MPRYVGEIVTAVAISLIAGWIFWYASDLPAGGGLFPQFAAVSTILLSVYWAATAYLKRGEAGRARAVDLTPSFEALKPLIVVGTTIAYVVLMFVLGFFLTTALFVIAVTLILGVRNWRLVAITLIVTLPLIYLFFVTFLGTRLPAGYAL